MGAAAAGLCHPSGGFGAWLVPPAQALSIVADVGEEGGEAPGCVPGVVGDPGFAVPRHELPLPSLPVTPPKAAPKLRTSCAPL